MEIEHINNKSPHQRVFIDFAPHARRAKRQSQRRAQVAKWPLYYSFVFATNFQILNAHCANRCRRHRRARAAAVSNAACNTIKENDNSHWYLSAIVHLYVTSARTSASHTLHRCTTFTRQSHLRGSLCIETGAIYRTGTASTLAGLGALASTHQSETSSVDEPLAIERGA